MLLKSLFVIAVSFVFAAEISQSPVSELALFNRCYAHITQNALPINHPLRADVVAGKITAVNACMSIFDSAKLNTSGGNEGKLINDTAEGRAVLLGFNDFHRSWFPNDNLDKSMPDEVYPRGAFIHDETEAALHLTRALFSDGVPYSSVVTGDSGMEALRSNGFSQKDRDLASYSYDQLVAMSKFRLLMWSSSDPSSPRTRIPMNAELLQTGELLGARRLKLNPNKQNFTVHSSGNIVMDDKNYPNPQDIPLHQSFGAGIIGTRSYLLLNIGRPNIHPSNGGVRMNRRWSKSVMSDLLCRDLPALRQSDAAPFVNRNPAANTPPFRNATSCMSCHSTMDPMAAVTRNISFMETMYGNFGGSMELTNWPVTMGAETGLVDDDVQFFRRPPNGKLFFRSYDGTLVDNALSSIPALGQAISQTKDLYVCAAAQYFQYFTGITANLRDLGDPATPPISSADLKYRNIVIQLGTNLKSNQSLRSLVHGIISSDLYRRSAMRDVAP